MTVVTDDDLQHACDGNPAFEKIHTVTQILWILFLVNCLCGGGGGAAGNENKSSNGSFASTGRDSMSA